MENEKLVELNTKLVQLKQELADNKNLSMEDERYISYKIEQFEEVDIHLYDGTGAKSETKPPKQKVADFERAIYDFKNE
ncbi:hypothetical protein [Sporosarcina sp. ZBG7A]|uniref:hypothetical protein n=1 Tax=Sporosarcina sp. ZBG7A TaxID=1582223 RepID=UPI00057A2BD3|nr:hypothetical protein [Sporosarcina sp. ZBG7A]